jgi:hypothetical protein
MKRNTRNFRKLVTITASLFLVNGIILNASAGEEFKTKRGKVYRDCEVISHDDYGIMIRHREGAARLAFSDLSEPVQQRYHYSPDAAAKFVQQHVPVRSSQIAHQRAIATHFNGFSPQLAATRAHLALAGGLLGAPFGGSLSVPGLQSFDAWQTDLRFAKQNPYHSSHTYKIKDGNVYLNNRRQRDRYDAGAAYQYAYLPAYNPNSYLQNQVRYGNPIAPAMNGNHIRATNGGNPIAPAMMSYSQFQAARARAISKAAPVRVSGGRGR